MFKVVVSCLFVALAVAQDVAEVKSKIQEINRNGLELLREGKLRELVDLEYAEDAKKITPSGQVIVGRDAIFEYLNKNARMYRSLKNIVVQYEYVAAEGDLAVLIVLMKAKITRGGREEDHNQRIVMVYRKMDDSYKAIIVGVGKSMGDGRQRQGRRTKRGTAQEAIKTIYENIKSLSTQGKLEDALTKFVADDAKFVSPTGKLIEGREGVAAELKKKLERFNIKSVSTSIDSVIDEGSWVVEIGVTTITAERNGAEKEMKHRHLVVWKKTTNGYVQFIRAGFSGVGDHTMGSRHHGGKRRYRRQYYDTEEDESEESEEYYYYGSEEGDSEGDDYDEDDEW